MSQSARAEVSQSLCDVCGAARKTGNQHTTDLAQAALQVARSEMGALPDRAECPMGGRGEPNCPLVRALKDQL